MRLRATIFSLSVFLTVSAAQAQQGFLADRQQEQRVPTASVALTPIHYTMTAQLTPSPSKELTAKSQSLLTQLGYSPGPIDGVSGRKTRRAIKAFQRNQGLVIDGQVSEGLIAMLRKATSAMAETTPVVQSAVIFTIDGIDALASVSGSLESRLGGATISYLKAEIEESWGVLNNDVHELIWTGRLDDTSLAIQQAKGWIPLLIQKARNENKALVIVAHSWGSVLAYRALVELYREGQIKNGDIDQLITFGSPLGGPSIVEQVAKLNADWIGAAAGSLTVREWRNYFIHEDCLAGPIAEGGVVDKKLPTSQTKCIKAHRAYFEDDKLLSDIGRDMQESLEAREAILAGRKKLLSETEVTPAAPPPSADDVAHDVVFGMTLSALTPQLRDFYQVPQEIRGVVISGVLPGGDAAKEGLCPGVVIVEVQQEPVTSPADAIQKMTRERDLGYSPIFLLFFPDGGDFSFFQISRFTPGLGACPP